MDDAHLPGDLSATLGLFRNAPAGFAALPEPLQRTAVAWLSAAPDDTTRHERIIEIVVASSEGDTAWFAARATEVSGRDG